MPMSTTRRTSSTAHEHVYDVPNQRSTPALLDDAFMHRLLGLRVSEKRTVIRMLWASTQTAARETRRPAHGRSDPARCLPAQPSSASSASPHAPAIARPPRPPSAGQNSGQRRAAAHQAQQVVRLRRAFRVWQHSLTTTVQAASAPAPPSSTEQVVVPALVTSAFTLSSSPSVPPLDPGSIMPTFTNDGLIRWLPPSLELEGVCGEPTETGDSEATATPSILGVDDGSILGVEDTSQQHIGIDTIRFCLLGDDPSPTVSQSSDESSSPPEETGTTTGEQDDLEKLARGLFRRGKLKPHCDYCRGEHKTGFCLQPRDEHGRCIRKARGPQNRVRVRCPNGCREPNGGKTRHPIHMVCPRLAQQ